MAFSSQMAVLKPPVQRDWGVHCSSLMWTVGAVRGTQCKLPTNRSRLSAKASIAPAESRSCMREKHGKKRN